MTTPTPERISRERALLEAYRDGELSPWSRWRVARRLRRDPAARALLRELESLAALLREVDAQGASPPDLWAGIRLRLVQADARRELAVEEAAASRASRRLFTYGALGLAAAGSFAVVLMLTPAAPPPDVRPSPAGSVRWIDARGHPMIVLRDDREATIIWVPERDS